MTSLLFGVIALLASPAHATDWWAVVVGVSDYADLPSHAPGRLSDLQYADDDAQAFASLLRGPLFGSGGVPADHIRLLVDEDATLDAVRSALRGFLARNAKPEDIVVVFFAGHGAPHPEFRDEMYLLLHDTEMTPDGIAARGLPLEDIQSALGRLKSNNVLLFADACHSAGIAGGALGPRGLENPVSGELLELGDSAARLVFTSSGAQELSEEHSRWRVPDLPGKGHGVFTFALLTAMMGDLEEMPEDGRIRLGPLVNTVTKMVAQHTDGRQRPMVSGSFNTDFPLSRLNVDAHRRVKQLLAEERRVQEEARVAWRDLEGRLATLDGDACAKAVLDFRTTYAERRVRAGEQTLEVTIPEVLAANEAVISICRQTSKLSRGRIRVRVLTPAGKAARGVAVVESKRTRADSRPVPVHSGMARVVSLLPPDGPLAPRQPYPIVVPVYPSSRTDVTVRLGAREKTLTSAQRISLVAGGAATLVGTAASVFGWRRWAGLTHEDSRIGTGADYHRWKRRTENARALNLVGGALALTGGVVVLSVPLMPRRPRSAPSVSFSPNQPYESN